MHLPEQIAALPPTLRDYIRELEARTFSLQQQASTLVQEKSVLQQQASTLQHEKSVLQQQVDILQEQFRLAQLKRFAPSSEKQGSQACLFNEAEQDLVTFASELAQESAQEQEKSAADDAEAKTKPSIQRRGRKPLPAHLKRSRVEHDLSEADKICQCA